MKRGREGWVGQMKVNVDFRQTMSNEWKYQMEVYIESREITNQGKCRVRGKLIPK